MKTLLSAVVGATLAFAVVGAGAQTAAGEQRVSLAIKSTTLAEALDQWAAQGGYQIIAPKDKWEIAKKLSVAGLSGTFTAQAALERLLEGTPLTGVWLSGRAVSIRERSEKVQPRPTSSTGRSDAPGFNIVAMSPAADPHTLGGGEPSGGPQRRTRGDADYRAPSADMLGEVIVTGSHIRGIENDTSPLTVLDREYIASTGLSTTTALAESLPQNFALASQSGVNVPGVTDSGTQGSSINLRGIGEGTTLILLNGQRMAPGFEGSAVDISALPVSALERVEILTDGASAIYGSDAIGGVVNFVLRSDFEGAETQARTGLADGGLNEYQASQLLGGAWSTGNGLLSLDYYKRDLLPANERDFVPSTSSIGSLMPRDTNYSAMLSGRQELSDALRLFGHALHTNRDSYNEGGQIALNETTESDNSQTSAVGGMTWDISGEWQAEISGSYSRNKLDQVRRASDFIALGLGNILNNKLSEIESAQAKIDGPVVDLPGGKVRLAIGADWRSESFQSSSGFENGPANGFSPIEIDSDQIVRSAFAELHVPLVGPGNVSRGARRVDLSIAGRIDDYSSFGSSFDPRFGLLWEPIEGLKLRGSYGTSYKAPRLVDYDLSANFATALFADDAAVAGGVSHQLIVTGADVDDFAAQRSESAAFGLEITPPAVPGLQIGLNYYKINYRDQIASPPFSSVVLADPAAFGSLIVRNPTIEQVNQYIAFGQLGFGFFPQNPDFSPDTNFSPDSINVILDLRRRNLSLLKTRGLDGSVQYAFDIGGGEVNFGLVATYILDRDQQVTRSSAPFETVDTVYNPPDWRARASAAFRRNAFSANIFVNHTGSYVDNRPIVAVPVSSSTTVDTRVSYDLGDHFSRGPLSGVTVAANVQNLFDSDPPNTAIVFPSSDMGFDPTNSSPLGRFVSVQVLKAW